MSLVSLVVAHNLVFLVAHGASYGDALVQTGHGSAWETAVGVVVAAGFGLLIVAAWRLHRLGLLARDLGARTGRLEPATGRRVTALVWLWLRLTASTAVLFAIQENLEHQAAGAALPGLAVLGSTGYPDALVVIAAVALVVAFVGALIRWRRDLLVARIAAALRRVRGRPIRSPRPTSGDLAHRWAIIGRGLAVRAPPGLARS
jgi:hypothetical protein